MGDRIVVEPHPVGVDQDFGALQRSFKSSWIIKMERESLHLTPKRVGPLGGSGEGLNGVPLGEQSLSDVLTGITKGSGHDVSGHGDRIRIGVGGTRLRFRARHPPG